MFGIDFLDKLISEVGLPLVKKGIKTTLGIDLESKELTAEDKQKIMDSQIEIMKIDFERLKLEKETVIENKRLDYQDTANSRDSNTKIQESPTLKFAQAARERSEQGEKIISLGLGEPEFEVPFAIVEATKEILSSKKSGYSNPMGLPNLRNSRFGNV